MKTDIKIEKPFSEAVSISTGGFPKRFLKNPHPLRYQQLADALNILKSRLLCQGDNFMVK